MPILPAEPNQYPIDLFDESAERTGRAWWVLHTKPRQEKSLARDLLQGRIPFYLPLLEHKVVVRGRFVQAHVPLFTSYLFLLAEGEERVTALSTRRVVHSLPVIDQADLWRDLGQVHRLINSGLPVTPEQHLYPGVSVEIRSGALAGLKGKILREASGNRFVVQVDFIQKGASVILDDYALAAVSA